MFETLDDGGNYEWLIHLRAFSAPHETRPLNSSSRDIKEIARCTTFNKDVARTYRAHEYSIPPMMVALHFFLPWLASSSSARLSRDEKQCKARKSIRRWRIDEWWFRLEVIFLVAKPHESRFLLWWLIAGALIVLNKQDTYRLISIITFEILLFAEDLPRIKCRDRFGMVVNHFLHCELCGSVRFFSADLSQRLLTNRMICLPFRD